MTAYPGSIPDVVSNTQSSCTTPMNHKRAAAYAEGLPL